ncbi:hypothetical protein U1Q18_016041 [Sarracenia purpurea var. burkii]
MNYQERFSEKNNTRIDEDSGKLTKSNYDSKGDSYRQGGNLDLERRIDIYCQKEGNVIYGPNLYPSPVRETLNGIMGPMSPLKSSPRDKNKRPDPEEKEKSLDLESNCANEGEHFLSRARNWKRRARTQEERWKSKEKQIIIIAEVGEKKRKSCNNGVTAEEQPDGKKCCSEGEKQRLEMEKQGMHLSFETAVADLQHHGSP